MIAITWDGSHQQPTPVAGETTKTTRDLWYTAGNSPRGEEDEDARRIDQEGAFIDTSSADDKGYMTGDTNVDASSTNDKMRTKTKARMETKTGSTGRQSNPVSFENQRTAVSENADKEKDRIQVCANDRKRYRRLAINEITVSSLKHLFLPGIYFGSQKMRNPISGDFANSRQPDHTVANTNVDLNYNHGSFGSRDHDLAMRSAAPFVSLSDSAAHQPTTAIPSPTLLRFRTDERGEQRSELIPIDQLESRFQQLSPEERDILVKHATSRAFSHLEWLYEWQKKYAPTLLLVEQGQDQVTSPIPSSYNEEFVSDGVSWISNASGDGTDIATPDGKDAREETIMLSAVEEAEGIVQGQALWDETFITLKRKNIPNITYTVDQVNEDVGIFLERYRDAVWSLPLQQIVNATLNGGIFPALVERQAASYPDLKRNVQCNPE
ncbi:hypothetical protein TGVAND_209480 [Toxoplasma gondii VAND]|uniref:Uncharacterized protein n=4 Tax=Toxoplasma gondii TaxID=5811 RepID=B9QKS3_TOXGV|nr:hypothetical protein TGVEG_209480 [Toxoplasma gondii VEG]KFG49718.1 hypothetical protein TGFOU_209480 [Toxoplasma gondii FOU]KFH05519.1 hypothetical protein TGVAND_209480 [Toxoplasma gondii VAND]PUA88183.1 hypothetical protein TGBR9_209480 [Toxoplasma gondii TgCATBr9]CEL71749.1 TPA: hypothetical protein BN1205_039080 [Toxoplasma gondii VEG]